MDYSDEEDFPVTDVSFALNDPFFKKELEEDCLKWMNRVLTDFDPKGQQFYTLDQLFYQDVEIIPKQQDDIIEVYNSLWDDKGNWQGNLPHGWTKVNNSNRTMLLAHPNYPNILFKFCKGSPGRGNPAAHFLRVPKGKELQKIVSEQFLDLLEVVIEELLCVKDLDYIAKLNDREQCYFFVVKSMEQPLESDRETINALRGYSISDQTKIGIQLAKLICCSGLGDIGFHNLHLNKDNGRLVVVDTEPLFGSLMLNEKSNDTSQYHRTKELLEYTNNLKCIEKGFREMISSSSKELPLFALVARVYLKTFQAKFPKSL